MRPATFDAPAIPRRALASDTPTSRHPVTVVRLNSDTDARAPRHNDSLGPENPAADWIEALSIGYVALAGSAALGLGIASVVLSR